MFRQAGGRLVFRGCSVDDSGSRNGSPFLERLKLFTKLGHHSLKPFEIIPAVLFLANFRAITNVSGAIRVLESIDRLVVVPFLRTDTCNHEGMGVATEGVLQQSGEFRVTVWDVNGAACTEGFRARRVAKG